MLPHIVTLSSPSPTPTGNPIEQLQKSFHITLPYWLFIVLSALAALAILAKVYEPLGKPVAKLWTAGAKLHKSKRSTNKEARRRTEFAKSLYEGLQRSAPPNWSDSHFAELEAEVKVDHQSRSSRILKRFGTPSSPRIRRIPSLTSELRETQERLTILEGDPGSGKSVALLHLAENMAIEASRNPDEHSVLPIYINMKTFRPKDPSAVSAEEVREFVLKSLNPVNSRDIDEFLNDKFESGRKDGLWLFLFDSFDETPAILSATEAGDLIEKYAEAVRGFLGIGVSRGIIASREFRGPTHRTWHRIRIMPLTENARVELIRKADLNDRQEAMLIDQFDTLEYSVQRLSDNPMFLSLLCEYVRVTSSFPEGAHLVLERFVQTRLSSDSSRIERRFKVDISFIRSFAEEMAFQMLESPDLGLSVDKSTIIQRVTQHLNASPDQGAAALNALVYSKLARFVEEDALGATEQITVAFSHRRIQEYFATRVVMRDRDRVPASDLILNGRWRETTVTILQNQETEQCRVVLTEAEAALRSCYQSLESPEGASCNDKRQVWPRGALHLLDLLASGLRPEDSSTLAVNIAANQILSHAWQNGNRTDKKWVVELCAAAGSEHAIEYLKLAFDSESLWLRDQAYAQVRRVGEAASRLEPQIRQMFFDLSVGGKLKRQRRSVSAQLLRLSDPLPLKRVMRLILVAPIASVIPAALAGLAMLLMPHVYGIESDTVKIGVVIIVLIGSASAVFLRRFSLVSDGRAQQYAKGFLSRVGLGDGEADKNYAGTVSLYLTFGLAFFGILFTLHDLLSPTRGEVRAIPSIYGLIVGVIFIWSILWPRAALAAATSGAWTAFYYWPILPLYPARRSFGRVRQQFESDEIVAVSVVVLISLAVGGIVYLLTYVVKWFTNVMLIISYIAPIVTVLFFIGRAARKAWMGRGDRGIILSWSRSASGQDSVRELQIVLQKLHTDEGVRLLLHEAGKKELQRTEEVAEFLMFLDSHFELDAHIDTHQDWVSWWDNYSGSDTTDKPLTDPSSETRDELGRLIEDARRTTAFASGGNDNSYR